MTKLPILLDVDPGHDDFFLILYSLFSQYSNIIGISTVGGNQSLQKTTINTLNALNIFTNTNVFNLEDTTNLRDVDFLNIPVVPGAEKSLDGESILCPEVHGESGLDHHDKDFHWPPLRTHAVEGIHSVNYFANVLREYGEKNDEKVHIIATGRLTNVALLFTMYPDVIKYVAQVTVMGGSFKAGGNTHPSAEFNIQIDPLAAQVVFDHGSSKADLALLQTTQSTPSTTTLTTVPVVLVPLDVTHTVLVTDEVLARVGKVCHNHTANPNEQSPFGKLLLDLLTFFADTYRDVFGFLNGPPLHDPVTFFYLTAIQHNKSNKTVIAADPSITPDPNIEYPSLFKTAHVRVDVDTSHGICRGTTCVDIHKVLKNGKPENVIIALECNVEAFWDHLLYSLEQANKQCILNHKKTD